MRGSVIKSLINTDPNSEIVAHVCPNRRCCKSKADYLYKMTTFFVACVSGCAPPRWPRHRWVGMDLTLEWFGLLEGLHRMWTQLYPLWCGLQRGKTLTTLGLAALLPGDAAPDAPPIRDEDANDEQAHGEKAQAQFEQLAVVSEANRTLGQAINCKRQEQSNIRWKALEWSTEKYKYCLFVIFCISRLVLEPMRLCMDSYIVASGHQSHVEWMRDEAAACKKKRHTGTSNLSRLLAGFHGDHTRDARAHVLHLMQSGLRGSDTITETIVYV